MHQTTVRFGNDLWDALEEECAELGVSIAQFVREAALARLMYVAGRRGDAGYDRALELSGASESRGEARSEAATVSGMLDRSAAEIAESAALWAQGQQARRRARELREEVVRRRHTER
jgi:ribosomal protein S19E (S16A)